MNNELKIIREAIEDLAARIHAEYSGSALTFPTIKRRMDRDMIVVSKALAVLDKLDKHDCESWYYDGVGCSVCHNAMKGLTLEDLKAASIATNARVIELQAKLDKLEQPLPPMMQINDKGEVSIAKCSNCQKSEQPNNAELVDKVRSIILSKCDNFPCPKCNTPRSIYNTTEAAKEIAAALQQQPTNKDNHE